MEGILDFVCLRQPFFHGHCININATTHSTLRIITSQSYFKSKNRDNFNICGHCNYSDLYYVFFILFNFCLAMLHKHSKETLGASSKVYYFNKSRMDLLGNTYRPRLFNNVFFQSIILQHLELRKNLTSGIWTLPHK